MFGTRLTTVCAAAAALLQPAQALFGRRRLTALQQSLQTLQRDAREFESNERVLLEQLRQMRLSTGDLRRRLRDDAAAHAEAEAAWQSKVAALEADVARLGEAAAAAEQRATAAEERASADAAAVAAARRSCLLGVLHEDAAGMPTRQKPIWSLRVSVDASGTRACWS